MSTPTPSSASKKTTGTPSYPLPAPTPNTMNYSSPAPPRSHPSPTAVRTAGKTPINHATGSSQGSKTLGGTPMMASLSQQGGLTVGSSPGAGALAGGNFVGTPVGLGMEGIATPAGAGLGGVPMMPTMSELGLGLGLSGSGAGAGGKRDEDAERRAKMRQVLKRIGRRTARVSEEGIVRVSRRVGFQTNLDDERKDVPAPHLQGNRTFTIAGKKILVDVQMEAQRPRKVEFMFASENEFLAQTQGPEVGKVLLGDLRCEGEEEEKVLAPTLDRFAANLERLARLDRWNSDHLDCFEALSGLHTNLQRLFEEERKKAATEIDVMCSKSGRPEVHARGELGLSLAYWQDPSSRMAAQGQEMHDGAHGVRNAEDGIFRLRLEVEPFAAEMYPPIRTSNAWLPDPLSLPETASTDAIPWQDPPPTLLPAGAEPMAIDGLSKPPDLRFVARLDPPLIMEHYTANTFLSSFGIVPPAPTTVPPPYHVVLLNPSPATPPTSQSATTATVPTLTARGIKTTHHHTLEATKQEFAFQLHELPFSHPRQLIDALPFLRQWATLSTLLKSAFPAASVHFTPTLIAPPLPSSQPLTPPTTPPSNLNHVPVQCALNTVPLPTLVVTYPCPSPDDNDDDDRLASKTIQVALNGAISVFDGTAPPASDDDPMSDVPAAPPKAPLMATALQRCADLAVWVEWLRSKKW
nr:mediator of rna polymerase ii transcription subunit 1 [Quercus suber]